MKHTKIITAVMLLIALAIALVSCQSHNTVEETEKFYEPLIVCVSERILSLDSSEHILHYIDFEGSGFTVDETTNLPVDATITVTSSDESIARYVNGEIITGNEYGKAILDFDIDNRKATVIVKTVPYVDYLKHIFVDDVDDPYHSNFLATEYYAAKWLINNLDRFKNPSSVSLVEYYYKDGEVTSEKCNPSYLIMEIRAQNGFGGYSIDTYKVTSYGIEKITMYGYQYNGIQHWSGSAYSSAKAVKEYIDHNY